LLLCFEPSAAANLLIRHDKTVLLAADVRLVQYGKYTLCLHFNSTPCFQFMFFYTTRVILRML
jgi:hypothetical protein